MSENKFKSGFIGLVGPTNSGKSTLLNSLVGEKVSIVSSRAQTTYHGVRGIRTDQEAQLVFVDTPGFQRHTEAVARLLNKVAERSSRDCDLLVWILDASNPRTVRQIEKLKPKITAFKTAESNLCVLNKVDKIPKESLLPMIQAIHTMGIFAEIIPLCAKTGDGVDRLVKCLKARVSEGEPLYPSEMVTDRSEQFWVAEMVREKIYEATHQEIPYSAWVEIEGWENPNETARFPTIRAIIHVDSSSRKGILIGKGGEMLKRIGSAARKEIETHLHSQVVLKLHVDVEEDWKKNPQHLNRYLELV